MTQSPRELVLEFDRKAIAARQWGPIDGVPVIALHGWLDNCASFDRLAPLLHGVKLIAVDMAGHGRSYHRSRDANYNIWEEVEDVVGIAQALGLRRFSLLAHSRGAIAAMLTAGAFPDRVERLALIDGLVPPPIDSSEAPQILAHAVAQRTRYGARKPRRFDSLQQAVEARRKGIFPLSEQAAQRLTERGTKALDDGFSWSSDPRLMATSTAKLTRDQVAAFLDCTREVPIRLVLARDGIADMIERLRPLLERYPHIAVQEMAGGHHLHMEAAGAKAVADWFGAFLRGEEGGQ
ncbi:alpha/beta fold hydrolase [Microbulbifer discodermiae]|uniref:alpha/beta fold hydrolase n=1 Tax=Microbulbifer sp. 2201CG32-9 TaxID=3232309 RepID=UPI00345B692F